MRVDTGSSESPPTSIRKTLAAMHRQTMRHLSIYIFGLIILTSCNEPKSTETSTTQVTHSNSTKSFSKFLKTHDRFFGVETTIYGPRGGVYVNPAGKSIPYRLFRIHLTNDTICPVELYINLPDKPIAQLPDTNELNVFLFSNEVKPDTIQDVYNFGIKGVESLLATGMNKSTTHTTLIQPKAEHIFYIGCITDGRDPQITFLPINSISTDTKSIFDFVFGIVGKSKSTKKYTLSRCGQVLFNK